MKKLYQTPQILVVKVLTESMIAVSGTLDRSQSISNSDAFGSRRGDLWDDEY